MGPSRRKRQLVCGERTVREKRWNSGGGPKVSASDSSSRRSLVASVAGRKLCWSVVGVSAATSAGV